jgi:hypothetical protein
VIDRLHTLFQQTFNRSSCRCRRRFPRRAERRAAVDDAGRPCVPGTTPPLYDWAPDDNARDFLGNEFLMWLWFQLDCDSDTIKLSDGSEVALMLARTLVLECPRGQTGRETISSDGPTRLPEARRAVQAGKLPRRVGVTVVRHDNTYECTLQAETLAVSGARLPPPEELEERARLEERVNQLRHMLETWTCSTRRSSASGRATTGRRSGPHPEVVGPRGTQPGFRRRVNADGGKAAEQAGPLTRFRLVDSGWTISAHLPSHSAHGGPAHSPTEAPIPCISDQSIHF